MIYITKITNKFKGEIDYPSPVSGFTFKIPEGGFNIYRTSDVYNILARYEEIIFLPGREEFKQMEESNVITRKLYPGKIKLVVRRGWTEPKRRFPAVWFLNLTEVPIVSVAPDIFNQSKRLKLFMQIPVLASVPVYSQFAQYRRYEIHPPALQPSQMAGAAAGSMNEIEDNRLEGRRSKQELDRLDKLLKEWKAQERDRIKLM